MLVNFCWTEWSIRLLYRLEVRSGDAGCYRLFYGCCWLKLEHVQEEGPSSASSTGMEFVGEKKKEKKPQQKVHTWRPTMMIFCVYANLWAGVLWLVLQHGPQQAGAIVRRDHIGQLPGFLN